ncbi:MAG TPA: pyruvate:ferredoxin (flavodoxin) oxidoreductase [Terriglobia bacterium]|nr:pyruvate:ferredoxin (flavodoxin) oxidoreductase [Terriglobia bacterium]
MPPSRQKVTIDGNEAAAYIAYHTSEVITIYPITPASPMGELSDEWAAKGKENIWGAVPAVIEMQSEAGAAGALHGAIQAGALGTTFTASQGLLLMIPNMYKIAGELTPTVIHVAARTLATHALSIFGDHSDVMACRQTGFAMLASNSVQEAMDMALVATAASLESRIPFLHFFDGFRTSHEVAKVEELAIEDIRTMIDEEMVLAYRARSLSPDRPVLRGSAQNPDVFFQARESANPFYLACPSLVQKQMDKLSGLVGRPYRLFDYVGAPDAERVIVLMGSGAGAAEETVEHLVKEGEKVGLLKVRLFRPFSIEHFVAALPQTVKTLAVLDRTKEPGATGDPLYLDVVTGLNEAMTSAKTPFKSMPRIIAGRYGLSSKEFTPAMVKAIFDEAQKPAPKNHFTIGIIDDVTHTSLDYDSGFSTEAPDTVRAVFFGLGSDGTVGANKNSIKIIGEDTNNYAQGYFVYDSKKAGAVTVSHLRFGPRPIRSTYLITQANFVACHQFAFLERMQILKLAQPGATFLLNSAFGPEQVWDHFPATVQEEILQKKLRVFVIDAESVGQATGMGHRINTIMQTCFFALSGVLPRDEAIAAIKRAIQKTYGKRGETVVRKNFDAVDQALAHLHEVAVPRQATSRIEVRPPVSSSAPDFVQKVTARLLAGEGDLLPVSALPVDGTFPTGTAQWEKRDIATEIPVWDEELCIQCGKCVLVCPHSVIRAKIFQPELAAGSPPGFKSAKPRWKEFEHLRYVLQVAPEDCTGCTLCVQVCPAKSKSEVKHKAINMQAQAPLRQQEAKNWEFFLGLPEANRGNLHMGQVKDVQLLQPLFEFSGACAGCGETPYIKLVTQLFGDHAVIANATGCSSIYGGNLPTTPYSVNAGGLGPAWSNSLFEDNAEFGLGIRLALDKQAEYARILLKRLSGNVGDELVRTLLEADQSHDAGIHDQRQRVTVLKEKLAGLRSPDSKDLLAVADGLVKKTLWIIGGDGWAYDIGYGGLDHVLSSGYKVNILVLDTEVYSNTGGQRSKATPRGAVARFAFGGKATPKKDLALMAMSYGNVYVARVAMGGSDTQTVKAFLEAEAHPGPSLIIAFSHCIAHGYDMMYGMEQQKIAVQTGYWPLFRYNPDWANQGKNPLQLDSRPPNLPLQKYMYNEARFTILKNSDPGTAQELLRLAQEDVDSRWKLYERLAAAPVVSDGKLAEAVLQAMEEK